MASSIIRRAAPADSGELQAVLVFSVPSQSKNLVHVIRDGEAVVAPAPRSVATDVPILPYLKAIEDETRAKLSVEGAPGSSRFRMTGRVAKGEVVSIQVSHLPGWRATANARPAAVTGDGLGLLVVKPDCDGPCSIEVSWDGPPELPMARAISALFLCVTLVCLFGPRRIRECRPFQAAAPDGGHTDGYDTSASVTRDAS